MGQRELVMRDLEGSMVRFVACRLKMRDESLNLRTAMVVVTVIEVGMAMRVMVVVLVTVDGGAVTVAGGRVLVRVVVDETMAVAGA